MIIVQFITSYKGMVCHIQHARKRILFFQRICKFVQTDLSLLSTNLESHALISLSNHNFGPNDCHSTYHFPTNIYDDSCITSFDIYGLPSNHLDTCQAVEALQPLLMVIPCPHYRDKPSEHERIYFSLQDSHIHHITLIENPSFQGFRGFQEDCFEFHDVIYDQLEASYLAILFLNNKH